MEKNDLFYARFMDDWIIIAPKRWQLRRAVRLVNETLNLLKVEQHPGKTFIGRAEHGIDFLGYYIKPGHLAVSQNTIANAAKCVARLYERGADEYRIGQYISRFTSWLFGGLDLWLSGLLASGLFYSMPPDQYRCYSDRQR